MTVIILEGCDAVGKTTFANTLAEELGYEVVRGSSFEISELGSDEMYKHMQSLLLKENVIIDRFMWSNLVYGKLYDYPMMGADQFDDLLELVDEKALVVYLYAPNGTIKYRMDVRGDDMVKKEEVDSILSSYSEEMYGDFRPSKMLSIDTTSDMNINIELIKKIVS